jgi:hypothetical protein
MKTTHKGSRIRIRKGRAVLVLVLLIGTPIAGVMNRINTPAQPTSWWYAAFLLGLLGIGSYCAYFVGRSNRTQPAKARSRR